MVRGIMVAAATVALTACYSAPFDVEEPEASADGGARPEGGERDADPKSGDQDAVGGPDGGPISVHDGGSGGPDGGPDGGPIFWSACDPSAPAPCTGSGVAGVYCFAMHATVGASGVDPYQRCTLNCGGILDPQTVTDCESLGGICRLPQQGGNYGYCIPEKP